ncbi:uncharacterized protein LOC118194264 [Stegodyphus dumicola]|uniref:uncharacterized protein LOC118194264 n=1 Tax=Stegodyphus dumicola TaxID=202533 RepID=UPI0015B042B8|nr:uncharacterized protein LOC118194264 [Stegodyphus dumicola]
MSSVVFTMICLSIFSFKEINAEGKNDRSEFFYGRKVPFLWKRFSEFPDYLEEFEEKLNLSEENQQTDLCKSHPCKEGRTCEAANGMVFCKYKKPCTGDLCEIGIKD